MEKHKLLPETNGYPWLEAIDIDAGGNLYFTDVVTKTLYRLNRAKSNTANIQPLLKGFKHLGGVSIDKANNIIYLGARLNKQEKARASIESKIIQIPLSVFGRNDPIRDYRVGNNPFDPAVREYDLHPEENGKPLSLPVPNGVVFDPKSKVVYYTHESLNDFGSGGYVGSTGSSRVRRFTAPNGIDIDPSSGSVLVFSQVTKKKIVRLNLPSLYEDPGEFSSAGGCLPDGIFCMENGDLLTTSFFWGRIYHLPKLGHGYETPRKIADGLDQPTDLVIGPSLSGKGESLFVTTTKILKVCFGGGGNVFEIPNVRKLIEQD